MDPKKWEFLKNLLLKEKSAKALLASQIKNLLDDVGIETNLKESTWFWDSAGWVTIPGGHALLSISLVSYLIFKPYPHVKTLKIDLDGQGSQNVFEPLTSVIILNKYFLSGLYHFI